MSRISLVVLLLFCALAVFGGHAGGEEAGTQPAGLIHPGSTSRCFTTFTTPAAGGIAIRNTCSFVATAYVWVAVTDQGSKRWSPPGAVYLVPRASVDTGFDRTLPLVIEGCPGRAFPVKSNGAAAADGPPSPYLCHP